MLIDKNTRSICSKLIRAFEVYLIRIYRNFILSVIDFNGLTECAIFKGITRTILKPRIA
jgi:hypothetical protein